jgi:hypothetical protein
MNVGQPNGVVSRSDDHYGAVAYAIIECSSMLLEIGRLTPLIQHDQCTAWNHVPTNARV